jgi:HTH-type transcriptional regulator / antitoxin HipB
MIKRLKVIKAKAFAIAEVLRDARKEFNMTQEELAKKTGTRRSFISRIENGHSDFQLSTLYRLVEIGFGKRVNLTIGFLIKYQLAITVYKQWRQIF